MSSQLLKRALQLEYATIAWNIFEGAASMTIGVLSGSIALFAYGLESSVEVFASAVVVWDLKGAGKKHEEQALKFIGCAYLIVSLYVFFESVYSLTMGHHAEVTLWGMILMIISMCAMLGLGLAKRSVGKKMGRNSVLADAKFTIVDALLSSAVLLGLLFNALFGWWWIDQAMALFLAGVAFREGLKEIL